jgi:hypothetical protein
MIERSAWHAFVGGGGGMVLERWLERPVFGA